VGSKEAGQALAGMHGQAQYCGVHEHAHHGGYVGHHPLEYEAVDHQGIFAGASVSDYWGSVESKCTDDSEQYASDVSSIVNNDVQMWESSPEVEDLEKLENHGPRFISIMSPQVSMMSPSCAPCYSSPRHMAPCPLPPPFSASSAETLGRDAMNPLDVYFDLQ
jgi:hypothetical protein